MIVNFGNARWNQASQVGGGSSLDEGAVVVWEGAVGAAGSTAVTGGTIAGAVGSGPDPKLLSG